LRDEPSLAKVRGGYYTPPLVASWLADWAIGSGAEQVLEPSAGDGVFARAVTARLTHQGQLTAVELLSEEASKIEDADATGRTTVVRGDVFSWWDQSHRPQFDVVIGNPPFIRYQHFPEAHRQVAFTLMRDYGLAPSRLTKCVGPVRGPSDGSA
jgi:adenine-specific DNA-methyltransferase